jgi:hypothetical protein
MPENSRLMKFNLTNYNSLKFKAASFVLPVYYLAIAILVTQASSCNASKKTAQDECQKYYDFIKNEWHRNDEGWYQFNLERLYALYDEGKFEYPYGICSWKGKSKAFIREMFGPPNYEIILKKIGTDMFIYCTYKHCAETNDVNGASGLTFYFNKEDKVHQIYGANYRLMYEREDRE